MKKCVPSLLALLALLACGPARAADVLASVRDSAPAEASAATREGSAPPRTGAKPVRAPPSATLKTPDTASTPSSRTASCTSCGASAGRR